MAKINIVTADLQSLSSKMKQADLHVGKARMMVSMAQSSLNMQVASMSAISSRLSSAKQKLTAQRTAISTMASLTVQAAEEFARADQGSGRIVEDLFNNLFRALGDMAGSLKNFIQSIVIKKHNQVAGVFLPAGSILTGSVISELLGPARGSGRHDGESSAGVTDVKPAPDKRPDNTANEKKETATQQTAKEEAAKRAKEERKKTLDEINTRYQNLPNSKSKKGFVHLCGALTFQQLHALGIVSKNTAGEHATHAKDYARLLAKKGKTSKGYICTGYTGNDALDKLLAANKGKLPITNIVCSFNKGGNIPSEADGHALLISKIDEAGNVYFVDNTKASNYKAVCLSLKEFKAFYFKKESNCSGVTHLHKP